MSSSRTRRRSSSNVATRSCWQLRFAEPAQSIKQQFQSCRPLFHLTRRSALFSEDGSNFTVKPRRDDRELLALRKRPFFVQVIAPVKRVQHQRHESRHAKKASREVEDIAALAGFRR